MSIGRISAPFVLVLVIGATATGTPGEKSDRGWELLQVGIGDFSQLGQDGENAKTGAESQDSRCTTGEPVRKQALEDSQA